MPPGFCTGCARPIRRGVRCAACPSINRPYRRGGVQLMTRQPGGRILAVMRAPQLEGIWRWLAGRVTRQHQPRQWIERQGEGATRDARYR